MRSLGVFVSVLTKQIIQKKCWKRERNTHTPESKDMPKFREMFLFAGWDNNLYTAQSFAHFEIWISFLLKNRKWKECMAIGRQGCATTPQLIWYAKMKGDILDSTPNHYPFNPLRLANQHNTPRLGEKKKFQ